MKNILTILQIILKGGAGSGNWGHAGRVGRRGGSTTNTTAMSFTTGRDAKRRQAAAKKDIYFKGNLKTASMAEVYAGSSQQIRDLADKTGIIATDLKTYRYVTKNQDKLIKQSKQANAVKYWQARKNEIPNKEYFAKVNSEAITSYSMQGAIKKANDPNTVRQQLNYFRTGGTTQDGNLLRNYGIRFSSDKNSQDLYDASPLTLGRTPTPKEKELLEKYARTLTPTKKEAGVKTRKLVDSMSDDDLLVLGNMLAESQVKDIVQTNIYTAKYQKDSFENESDGYYISGLAQGARDKAVAVVEKMSGDDVQNILQGAQKGYGVAALAKIQEANGLAPTTKRIEDFRGYNNDANKYKVDEMMGLADTTPEETFAQSTQISSTWDNVAHKRFRGKVNNVFRIKPSDTVEKKWDEASKVGNVKSDLYHGTDVYAAQKISNSGFKVMPDPKAGRMIGDGIYLADNSSKSIQYIGSKFGRGEQNGILFSCKAALGKVNKWSGQKGGWAYKDPKKYPGNTIFAPKGTGVVNSEWSVKNADAVVPVYWIDIDRINK